MPRKSSRRKTRTPFAAAAEKVPRATWITLVSVLSVVAVLALVNIFMKENTPAVPPIAVEIDSSQPAPPEPAAPPHPPPVPVAALPSPPSPEPAPVERGKKRKAEAEGGEEKRKAPAPAPVTRGEKRKAEEMGEEKAPDPPAVAASVPTPASISPTCGMIKGIKEIVVASMNICEKCTTSQLVRELVEAARGEVILFQGLDHNKRHLATASLLDTHVDSSPPDLNSRTGIFVSKRLMEKLEDARSTNSEIHGLSHTVLKVDGMRLNLASADFTKMKTQIPRMHHIYTRLRRLEKGEKCVQYDIIGVVTKSTDPLANDINFRKDFNEMNYTYTKNIDKYSKLSLSHVVYSKELKRKECEPREVVKKERTYLTICTFELPSK